jgi:hypothetical protein
VANKFVVATTDMTYVGPGGSSVTAPRKSISAPYQAQNAGQIDVAAAAAKDAEFVIPFGAIGTSATLLRIDNNTDVRLCLKMNGAAAVSHAIPPGGSQTIAAPAADDGTVPGPLLSATALLGEIATVGGTIDYWVFGDPTA